MIRARRSCVVGFLCALGGCLFGVRPIAAHEYLWDEAPPVSNLTSSAAMTGERMVTLADVGWLDEMESAQGLWTGRIGALLLTRSSPSPETIVYSTNGGGDILNANDFNFSTAGSIDLAFRWHGQIADVDFRYFGVQEALASIGPVNAPGGTNIILPGFPPNPNPFVLEASLRSTLQSAELNLLRQPWRNLGLLAGIRYVQLRDKFIVSDGGPIGFRGQNEMIGGQIGCELILWEHGERFRIESALKSGIFGNASSFGILLNPNGSGPAINFEGNIVSFVGDVNITAVYRLADQWAIRAGYQLLWAAGVINSTEQLKNVHLTSNGMALDADTNGSAFFQGAMIGVEYGW